MANSEYIIDEEKKLALVPHWTKDEEMLPTPHLWNAITEAFEKVMKADIEYKKRTHEVSNFPIGYVIMSLDKDFDPNTLKNDFGYQKFTGVWTKETDGYVVSSANTTQTSPNFVGKTKGSDTVSISKSNLPETNFQATGKTQTNNRNTWFIIDTWFPDQLNDNSVHRAVLTNGSATSVVSTRPFADITYTSVGDARDAFQVDLAHEHQFSLDVPSGGSGTAVSTVQKTKNYMIWRRVS